MTLPSLDLCTRCHTDLTNAAEGIRIIHKMGICFWSDVKKVLGIDIDNYSCDAEAVVAELRNCKTPQEIKACFLRAKLNGM